MAYTKNRSPRHVVHELEDEGNIDLYIMLGDGSSTGVLISDVMSELVTFMRKELAGERDATPEARALETAISRAEAAVVWYKEHLSLSANKEEE